MNARKTQ